VISFIVPAYNEERLLGSTLEALHAAARAVAEPYELILVDDGSVDGTVEIARANGARVVRVEFRHIARTRNAGAHAALGGTLIFVDADTIVPAATLRATIEALAKGAVGGGATVHVDGRLPLWARLALPVVSGILRAGRLAAGCYVFCSRAAFDASGGFDEHLYAAEEIAFSRSLRQQGRVVILRESVTTSGRKLRAHSGWEVLRLTAAIMRHGTALVRSRDRLSIWYGDRHDDL
jgi:cellulose synthase/poly-beta-1,6-N-acetylglucosamine synthase-like glycosyltransferase